MIEVSLEKLLDSGAHFGHQMRRWNPRMRDYMHTVKDGVFVFDLIKTKECLVEALDAIALARKENKNILIVGTKKQAKDKVVEMALEHGIFYVSERFLGGTLTNFGQVRKSVTRLNELKETLKTAASQGYTKKERLLMEREIQKLTLSFGGVLEMDKIPDLMIIIDTHKERGALLEASKTGVQVVGVVDSNGDPDLIDWPIPMNDDASSAVEYVLSLINQALTKKVVSEKKDKVKSVSSLEKKTKVKKTAKVESAKG